MARKPRLHYPGALYHVVLRGNAGEDIFLDDSDRLRFLELLEEGIERFGHRIHAFCLMTNHLHLALQVAETPLSRIAHNFAFRHTQRFNKRHRRSGHVFQGRYRAILVNIDSYLLELVRYIHLNPLRAGVTESPARYRWSSHPCYLGRDALSWVTTEFVLSQFGGELKRARSGFHRFVLRGRSEERYVEAIRRSSDQRVLGDDSYAEEVLRQTDGEGLTKPTLDQVIQAVCRLYGIDEQRLAEPGKDRVASEARAMVAWRVQETSGISLAEAARRFNRDASSLSAAVTRLLTKARSQPAIGRRMGALKQETAEIPQSHA